MDGGLGISRVGNATEPFTCKDEAEQIARDKFQEFVADIQAGKYKGQEGYPEPAEYFAPQAVDQFLQRWTSMYVKYR